MERVRSKVLDVVSWAGPIDETSVADRWSLALRCAARELEDAAAAAVAVASCNAPAPLPGPSCGSLLCAAPESLNQLLELGNVFDFTGDALALNDRLVLCAMRAALALSPSSPSSSSSAASSSSHAAALRMADDLVCCFLLPIDGTDAGGDTTVRGDIWVLPAVHRAVLQTYVSSIADSVAALPPPLAKTALDEIFRSWFIAIKRLADSEEGVECKLLALKVDFLRHVISHCCKCSESALSQYFEDALEIFLESSSALVQTRQGGVRDLMLKGLLIPVIVECVRRGGERNAGLAIAALHSLAEALAKDLLSLSALMCAILNEGAACLSLAAQIFSDATTWNIVVACFLSKDAIVRKRACFITDIFIQHWDRDTQSNSKSSKAAGSKSRLWLLDFVDAYRQVESCSYLHLVYQIWGHLERLCTQIDQWSSGETPVHGQQSGAASVPAPSFPWLRALLECLLSSNVVSIRKHTLFMILTERIRLPLTPDALGWVCTYLLHAMDASSYFPVVFGDVIVEEASASNIIAQLGSIVSGGSVGSAAKGQHNLLKDPLLEHPGVLLPSFIARIIARCRDNDRVGVPEFIGTLLRFMCARRGGDSSSAEAAQANAFLPSGGEGTRVKSLTAIKWTLLAFARADLQELLSSSSRCLGVGELMNIRLFINDRLSCANSTVRRQVLHGLRPLLVSCARTESIGPSHMFRQCGERDSESAHHGNTNLVDVLIATGWSESIAECKDLLKRAATLWAENLGFRWAPDMFEKGLMELSKNSLLDPRDSYHFALLAPYLDASTFPDLTAVHQYFVSVATTSFHQPYTAQSLQQLGAMHARGILECIQNFRMESERMFPVILPFLTHAIDFSTYIGHSINSLFYSENPSGMSSADIRCESNIHIESVAQLEAVCSLTALPVAVMTCVAVARDDDWWSPQICETAGKVIDISMGATISLVLSYIRSNNGATLIPSLRVISKILSSFIENIVNVISASVLQRIITNAVARNIDIVSNAMCDLSLCTYEELRVLVDRSNFETLSTVQRISIDECSHFGKYASTCNELRWNCLKHALLIYSSIAIDSYSMNPAKVLSTLLDMMELSPSQSLPDISICLSVAANSLIRSEMSRYQSLSEEAVAIIRACIDTYWRTCMSEEILECTHVFAFVQFTFSKAIIEHSNLFGIRKYFDLVIDLGLQGKPHLIQHLVLHLVGLWKSEPGLARPFMDAMRRLLVYREPPLDDYNAVEIKESPEVSIMERRYFPVTRLMLLHFFENLGEDTELHSDILQLMTDLVEMNLEPAYAKHAVIGSEAYGEKLRCWQALCVLSKFATESWAVGVMPACVETLRQNCGHAIRVHMEFFVALLMCRFPSHVLPLIVNELRVFNHSLQTTSSLFVILGHACESSPFFRTKERASADTALQVALALLPWMTCAPGLSRSIAQLVAYRVIPVATADQENSAAGGGDASVITHLTSIWQFLNVNKDASKMRVRQGDFFRDYNLFAKSSLSGLVSVRPYDGDTLKSSATVIACSDYTHPHLLNVLTEFIREETSEESKIAGGATSDGADEMGGEESTTLQTKRIPIDELQLTLREEATRMQKNGAGKDHQDTIVCASLVGKATNLGGLARTCEIFAAKKLVVSSLSILSNEVFQNIAVSSASWLPIEEVPINDLAQYLRRCKAAGYCIVGLEQTDSSVSLVDFQAPRRCVLLLGREREGIPVELLQEVDVCVEIPQFGVTRSLNVHVSASIALWEITKQNKSFLANSLSQK